MEPHSKNKTRLSSHLSSQSANPRIWIWALTLALLLVAGGLLMAQDSAGPAKTLVTAQTALSSAHDTLNPPDGKPREIFDPAKLLFAFVLICVNAFFSIAEYSLITVRRTRIRQLAEEGSRNAAMIESLLAHPTRLMATIQTGVTVLVTISSALAATSAVGPLGDWIKEHSHGHGFAYQHYGAIALVAVTLPVAIVALVVGEVAPKSLVVRNPEPFALFVVEPIRWLQIILAPIVGLLTFLSNMVVKPFGGTVSFTIPSVNKEELEILVEQSVEQGVVDEGEKNMLTSILDFGDTVARRIMTPRIDLTAFPVTGSMPDLIGLVYASGHSRIPIYEGDLDNIVGIIHAKDLLQLVGDDKRDTVPIRDVMRPPYFIPETKKVDELLAEFKRSKQQLAMVRDEYGVTSGLVTIEDVVEEIVGDIQDEYDEEEPQVQVLSSTTSILDGKMSLSDVNERMGLHLPEDEADTIGGFVFGLLGHAAAQGERAQWEDTEFIVEETDGRRITKIRLIRLVEESTLEQAHPANASFDSNGANGKDSSDARRSLPNMETTPRLSTKR